MKPSDAQHRLLCSRRDLLVYGGLLLLTGCTGPAIRSQSPESAELTEIENEIRLVGDVAGPYGLDFLKVEGPALVTGLKDTGVDPPPSSQRSALLADMQARDVVNPAKVLASPTNSLVWVRTFLPPGIQKGETLDVEVRVPANVETTDLSGGWMMQTRLKQMAVLGNSIKEGHVLAIAEGAVLVDPVLQKSEDSSGLQRGRVLSAARVLKSRNLGLVLRSDEKSVYVSKQIGDALNRRFHTFNRGTKQGIATPKNDEFVDLVVHPRYQHNLPRYLRVVRSIALTESPSQQLKRLELLEQQLMDPFTAANAAIRLEAIGKAGIKVLHKGLAAKDAEVRFYSAEALAYLDDAQAAKPLADAARNEPAFRVFALTALSTMDDVAAADELRALLDVPSAETRYGAFRALWGMNKNDPLVRGENLSDKLSLHIIASTCTPMVHVTRSYRAEVVLFGQEQRFQAPFTLEAGKAIVVKAETDDQVVISRFAIGAPDRQLVVSSRIEEVIRAVVAIGGHYPDVVQLLQSARVARTLPTRLEVDALPAAGRRYDRGVNSEGSEADDQQFEVTGSLPNLFGNRSLDSLDTKDSASEKLSE